MVQPGAGAAAVGTETQPSREPGGEISRLLTPSRQACWTIPVLGRTTQPTCARNYVPTRDGQCCLASQMTKRGVCCPAGQRPDARGEQCVGQFVPVIPQRETCGPDQTGVWPNCCPIGQYWDGKRCITPPPRQCPPDSIGTPPECRCRPPLIGIPGSCVERPCPLGQHRVRGTCVPDIGIVTCPAGQHPVGRICVPDVGPCPQGQHRVGRTCVPNVVICPRGKHRVGDTCVPNVIICPRGKHRVGDTCVPNIIVCPRGQHRVGDTCVPMRLELRQKPPQLQLRRTQPQFQLKQPLRRTGPGPY
jgi:hypothetical protein